jgi:hypothetical protein
VKNLLVTLFATAALVGCSDQNSNQAGAQPANAAPSTRVQTDVVQTAAPAATPAASGQVTGKVLETMDAAGYTYLRVETSSGEKWAAVSATSVKKGDTVTIAEQMTAENFESKTLNRKFDKIIFGTIGGGTNAAPAAMGGGMAASSPTMPAGHPPTDAANAMAGSAMGTPAQHMSAPATGAISVPKAEGPGAKTVAEVWGEKASLNNKPVVVRAKVVKFLGGIMGKNWVHVRDGSGADGTNDLTVTTDDVVAVGDVVTVRGTVRAGKDFGAGYKYEVIVEDAKVAK